MTQLFIPGPRNILNLLGKLDTLRNPEMYYAFRLGLVPQGKTLCLKLRRGPTIEIRPQTFDRNIFGEIWIKRDYTRPPGFNIRAGDIVVDIGAHIGIFSLFAANNGARVYSFEPVPENFRLLKRNIQRNGLGGVITAANMAVFSRSGEIELYLDNHNCGGHSTYVRNFGMPKIRVPCLSLEELVKNNRIEQIDFLKMDCEGSEYDILCCCPEEVLRKIKRISMEYHTWNGHTGEELKRYLERCGFAVEIRPVCRDILGMLYARNRHFDR